MSTTIARSIRVAVIALIFWALGAGVANLGPAGHAQPERNSSVTTRQAGREVRVEGTILGIDTTPERPSLLVETPTGQQLVRAADQIQVGAVAVTDKVRIRGRIAADGMVDILDISKVGTAVRSQDTATDNGGGDSPGSDNGDGSGNGSGDNDSGDNGSGDNDSGDNGSGDNDSGDNDSGDNGSGDNDSGDNGSGDNDSGDNGSGDNGSGDNGSGDNGSGDNGSGDNDGDSDNDGGSNGNGGSDSASGSSGPPVTVVNPPGFPGSR
jgi:hypothetical protein